MMSHRFSKKPLSIEPDSPESMRGAGVEHKNKRFITHTTLHHDHSALVTFTRGQIFFISLIFILIAGGLIFRTLGTLKIVVAIMSFLYFIDIFFNMFIIGRSLKSPPEISYDEESLARLDSYTLPVYTVLCPLYRESHVLPQFVASIEKMDWPKDKLDVQLLLEEDDEETIHAAKEMHLPDYFRVVVVPQSLPKTKPKACNYGLNLATGEYLVIYDAEDIPDPQQLKKAYIAFLGLPDKVKCLQAKLNYFNPKQNLLTRLFTIEYSLWFDVTLPGLQSIETMIPLGGTSNHFRTRDLRQFKGWDPFNVTEDCDLGVRLFKAGYQTAIIDSVTLEEANSVVLNWIRQRSRWIKGYMQTFLVHMRNPVGFFRTHGMHALYFQLIVGGKIAFMLINPIMWLLTISYFALYAYVGPAIESLYPGVIFGMALTSLVFGNFMFMYCYMIGVAKRKEWHLMKYVFLQPVYWLGVSVAAGVALYQLIVKPHFWEKTHHGIAARQKVNTPTKDAHIPSGIPMNGARAYIAAMMGAYALNFAYNWYLSRTISLSDFGTLSLIGTFVYIAQVLFLSLSRTVGYHSAFILGKYGVIIKKFWRIVATKSVYWGIGGALIWLASIPFLRHYFMMPSWPLLTFVPVIAIGTLYAVDSGFLSGQMQYSFLSLIILFEAGLKLIFTFIAVQFHNTSMIYLALPLSMAAGFIFARILLISLPEDRRKIPRKLVRDFPKKFFTSSFVSKVSVLGFMSADLILAKHFLSADAAGIYALLSLIGKGIYFAGSLPSSFITSIVARETGEKVQDKSRAQKFILLSAVMTTMASVVIGVFGSYILPVILGSRSMLVIPYLPWYVTGAGLFTMASVLVIYFQARNRHIFSFVSLAATVFQIIGMLKWHGSVNELTMVLAGSGALQLLAILFVAAFQPTLGQLKNFGLDLFSLFGSYKSDTVPPDKLKFLVFNWRDTKHKWAGGAEVYIQEIAKEWIAQGHKVTLFCGSDGKRARNEVVDGIQVIRRGGVYTVYIWAFVYYILRLRGLFDVVIDCENGIPFFTPFYVRVPKFLLIFHVHQKIFREHLNFPLRQIAQFMEKKLMPYAYRKEKVITISPSTHDELINLGIVTHRKLDVIHPGVQASNFVTYAKTAHPSFVYIGRLKPYKNVDTAIRAFYRMYRQYPTAHLTIAGTGESRRELENMVNKLGFRHAVEFTGRITDESKHKLLATSWAALQPSSYEGWGLTVIEANAAGTPVIASNVPGLRDAVVEDVTGLLVPRRNDAALAHAMVDLTVNTAKRQQFSRAAQKWAGKFRWDVSANKFIADIYLVLNKEYAEANWPN